MRKIYAIVTAGLIGLGASAGNPVSEALPFTQLDFNPASFAMASSRVNSAAILPFSSYQMTAGIGYEDYMPEVSSTQYISGGVAGRYQQFGASLNFTRGTGEEIQGEYFTPSEVLVNLGLSYAFLPSMAVGVNVKYAKEQVLNNYSYSAAAADVFVAGVLGESRNIHLAGGVSNIGGSVASESTGEFFLPAAATLAFGYHYGGFTEGKEPGGHRIELDMKGDYFFSGKAAFSIGAEYGYGGVLFARAGYHYGGESVIPSYASAGLGLHWMGFGIDAVYLFASEALNNTFALTLGISF